MSRNRAATQLFICASYKVTATWPCLLAKHKIFQMATLQLRLIETIILQRQPSWHKAITRFGTTFGQGSGKFWTRFGQGSDKVRTRSGQSWTRFGQGLDKVRARFGQGSGKVRASFGQGSDKVWTKFGQGSGKVRIRFGQGSDKVRTRFDHQKVILFLTSWLRKPDCNIIHILLTWAIILLPTSLSRAPHRYAINGPLQGTALKIVLF